jgi:hypothetical protein
MSRSSAKPESQGHQTVLRIKEEGGAEMMRIGTMATQDQIARCSVCQVTSTGSVREGYPAETAYGTLYPLTFNGQPTGKIRGFICARCLKVANKMRHYFKSQEQNVQVSKHAIDRYLERQKGERISEEAAKITILRLFGHAHRIVFKDRFMAQRLFKHGKPVDYLFHQGWIFVVSQDEPVTILTAEQQWHRKLGYDFWYVEPPELNDKKDH